MLAAGRLTDQVTILTATLGARDSHGNKPQTWTAGSPVPGLFQQQATTELLDQRDAVTTRGVLFLPPDVVLTATSRVQLASLPNVTWRVVGDPNQLVALGGRPDHSETILERVTS